MTGRILAWINLAYRFGGQILVRVPRRLIGRSRGAAGFLGDVVPEGYVPLTAAERAAYPSYMGCVSCGLCALACTPLVDAPASAWEEAWTFVVGPSRSVDRAPLAAAGLGACPRSPEGDAVCPAGVPISRIAATIDRLASAGTAPAAPPGAGAVR